MRVGISGTFGTNRIACNQRSTVDFDRRFTTGIVESSVSSVTDGITGKVAREGGLVGRPHKRIPPFGLRQFRIRRFANAPNHRL
jgi:hypothetical protein